AEDGIRDFHVTGVQTCALPIFSRCYHQVAIEDFVRAIADRFHNRWAEGDIGHKMSIHHVEVNPVGASRGNGLHFFSKAGEIRRQNGWRYGYGTLVAHGCSDFRAVQIRNRLSAYSRVVEPKTAAAAWAGADCSRRSIQASLMSIAVICHISFVKPS